MPAPTLGCQIAPHYHPDSESESESDDSTLEEESVSQRHGEHAVSSEREAAEKAELEPETPLSIEKAETQRDILGTGRISRPTTLGNRRTKSNRSQVPPEPVGFWCWQMVWLGFVYAHGRMLY